MPDMAYMMDGWQKTRGIDTQRSREPILIPLHMQVATGRRMSGDQNWYDRQAMAGLVEMLEVEAIAIDLVQAGAIKLAGAQLIFDHKHNTMSQQNQVRPPPHARDQKFQKGMGIRQVPRQFAQMLDLVIPCGALCRF